VALVGLFAGAGNVIPESDAGIEGEGKNVAAIGGEADCCYWGVVFVDKGSETLACCRVPDSTETYVLVMKLEKTRSRIQVPLTLVHL
jgi:hypothetical protein